jgi:hypothetical protein
VKDDDLVFPCGCDNWLEIYDTELCAKAICRREDQRIIDECLRKAEKGGLCE